MRLLKKLCKVNSWSSAIGRDCGKTEELELTKVDNSTLFSDYLKYIGNNNKKQLDTYRLFVMINI